MDEEELDQEDLTSEMEDPTTENTISEVKVTPANVSRPDMQSQKVKSYGFKRCGWIIVKIRQEVVNFPAPFCLKWHAAEKNQAISQKSLS